MPINTIYTKNKEIILTYRFLRVVMLVRTLGNGPDNLFPIKELHIQLTKIFSVIVTLLTWKKEKIQEAMQRNQRVHSRKFLQILQTHGIPLLRYRTSEVITTKVSVWKCKTKISVLHFILVHKRIRVSKLRFGYLTIVWDNEAWKTLVKEYQTDSETSRICWFTIWSKKQKN